MRKNTQPYEYNGVRGLKAIAKANGVAIGTVRTRMMRGLTLEEALNWGLSQASNNALANSVWKGAKGIPAIAKKAGVSEGGILAYLKQGKTIDEAIDAIKVARARIQKANDLKRANRKSPAKKQVEGIKKPYQLNPLWGLALGMTL